MASVGRLDKRLLAIKPKRCRIRWVSTKEVQRIHGKGTGAIAFPGRMRTIIMPTNLPKEDIAHEFGHVALGHGLVTKRVTIGGYIKGELEAWQWAAKKWKKQELPEKSWIVERKRWVFQVAAQAILEFYLTVEDALAITKEEIKKLKMKPLTQSEVKWLTSRLKVIRKDAVGELKNLGKDKDWVKKVEREANK